MYTDEILIENTLKGDMGSFSTLVLKYKDRIYSFLLKMTFSKQDSEELLQEVFIKVYNNLYKYNSNWSFSSWVYKIAANTFKNYYKEKKRHSLMDYYFEIPDLSCDLESCPEFKYELKENYAEVVKLINELKYDQKIALILRHVKGLSFKEIGNILNISPEASKMKVQRAKQHICEKFEYMKERGVLK